ncbi:MAG: hypothetical protein AAGG68_14035 [Bacteroidota bacterium]
MVSWLKRCFVAIKPFNTLALITLLSACSEPPAPALLYEDRQVVDSLYQLEYEKMVDSLDAACDTMLITQIDETVDSILKVRLVEIVKQKQRYQKLKAKENEVQ